MPLFSRSSERKPAKSKSHHRFSLRKHHHSDAAEPPAPVHKPQPRRATGPTRAPEHSVVAPRSAPSDSVIDTKSYAPPSGLSSSVRSSASTVRSTSPNLQENLSGGENDTDISEESEIRDSVDTSMAPRSSTRQPSLRDSYTSSGQASTRSSRNSLAEYRQLQCSMSYKNRVNSDAYRGTSTTASLSESSRMSDMRASLVDGFRPTSTSVRSSVRSSTGHNLLNERISESSTAITSAVAPAEVSPVAPAPAEEPPVRMTEASVAALQTRRAFQQMVLAMEDEESGDEYDSDSDMLRSSESSPGSTGVVRLGADEYRKFQFRLRQLEELTAEQARKQADMEQTIEQEVQERTRKVIEAMEKQISMYKQAKELECEREVQRRVSEHLENPRMSRASRASMSRRSSAYGLHTSNSVGSFRDSYSISGSIVEEGKPLEKLLHPRRSRKRLEQMKEREEAQKREMEQFREFIRSTEMRVTQTQGVDGVLSAVQLEQAKSRLEALNDPLLPESLLQSPPSELIELICVLRKNGHEQEKQLEEAKSLVNAAIEAREEAEATAREAVELTEILDARLDRAAREEQKLVWQARKLSAADEFRHARTFSSASVQSSDFQLGTPATSSVLE